MKGQVETTASSLRKIEEEHEETFSKTKKPSISEADEPMDEKDSFDLKIFPKLYQSLFQIGSKSFDTDSLLKCLSAEIKTYEQYEKFVVARYMFWKYFSKLKANFYCDSCEVILTENRFVCLECREHCLCFNCFSKSVIDETGSLDSGGAAPADATGATATNPKAAKKKNLLSNTHKSSHRMLLLDHICNKCGSLIIGKRFHCEECDDYDLCLMCYKRVDSPSLAGEADTSHQHDKCHKTSIIEPVILVAKPEHVLDVQVYLYLHSQMLFTVLTLRVSNLIAAVFARSSVSLMFKFSISVCVILYFESSRLNS